MNEPTTINFGVLYKQLDFTLTQSYKLILIVHDSRIITGHPVNVSYVNIDDETIQFTIAGNGTYSLECAKSIKIYSTNPNTITFTIHMNAELTK